MDHEEDEQKTAEGWAEGERAGDAVCIVGNVNTDILMKPVPEIPEWGTEAMVDSYEERLGGCAGNSAVVLAALGQETHIVASVGNDHKGKDLTTELRHSGVKMDGLKIAGLATGVSLSFNRPDGERLFVTYPGAMLETGFQQISDYLSRVPHCVAMLLTGYFLLSPEIKAREVLRLAIELGMVTLLDTGWPTQDWRPEIRKEIFDMLPYVDYFLPNEVEANAVTSESSYKNAAKILAAQCRKGVAIKRGAEGSYFLGKNEEIQSTGFPVEVKDTVGAGDSFNAGFIYGLIRDWPVSTCMEFGNSVAASVISNERGFNLQSQVQSVLKLVSNGKR
ncbi:MAG: PfkB domain protein [Paenibacillaceae bacterium]|jgi:sugar/nucleoside kinase (ribokinase family)|nr:PfkB domain protein [Paenibacillaceae bacterium]